MVDAMGPRRVRDEITDEEVSEISARLWNIVLPHWRPIETAPVDGTHVLVWDGYVVLAHSSDPEHWYESDSSDPVSGSERVHPTHWMPLPEPPTSA